MSDDAKALLHYVANWRYGNPHDADTIRCFHCAVRYGQHISFEQGTITIYPPISSSAMKIET
jgi:hypothetical protein